MEMGIPKIPHELQITQLYVICNSHKIQKQNSLFVRMNLYLQKKIARPDKDLYMQIILGRHPR